MEDYTIWCIVIDEIDPFLVELHSTKTVDDLKDKIKEKKQNSIDADQFNLYLINVDGTKEKYLEEVRSRSQDLSKEKKLDPLHKLSKVFKPDGPPKDTIHILVQPPPRNEPDEQDGDSHPDSVMLENFRQQVTFKLGSLTNWKVTDLLNNKIEVAAEKSQYIIDLQGKLSRKRLVTDPDAVEFNRLTPHLTPPESKTYFSFSSDPSTDILQKVTSTEVLHYFMIFKLPMFLGWFLGNKKSHIGALLHTLDCHVNQIDTSQSMLLMIGHQWGFHLIAESGEIKRKYTPKSDASLRIEKFPLLLLEINSDPAESDCNRMLLQAACLARLGNALRMDSNPFIVSAIYIDSMLFARWHFVYQPRKSDTAVKFVVEHFDLKDAKRTFAFVFRLYNFVALAREDNKTLHNLLDNVVKLHGAVEQMNLQTLTTRDDSDAGNGSPEETRNEGGAIGSDIFSDVATMEALNRAGYTIPDEIEGFELLVPLTTKTLHAVSADGEDVIVKLTDEHEVEVLRYLHAKQSTKHTRIIPLLDVVLGRLIVLPLRTPLSQFLVLDASAVDVEQLALQFLQGVAYLQQTSVAHLDLKPDNIVVQRDPESKEVDLAIIDFNIAVFANVEPMISAPDGTPGWWAPEVSAETPYNPLLADRWSCGRVLSTFTNHMKPSQTRDAMRSFSQQLMDPDPSLRPPVTNLPTCLQKTRRGADTHPPAQLLPDILTSALHTPDRPAILSSLGTSTGGRSKVRKRDDDEDGVEDVPRKKGESEKGKAKRQRTAI